MGNKKCIFGPVSSRRLGRSLGIDLLPLKTCTYNCIYCQLGKHGKCTVERSEWIPEKEVLRQAGEELRRMEISPDWLSLSGSGEPTLHVKFGGIISNLKQISGLPVALITNGSLLWLPEVRNAAGRADLIIPSLDAGSPEVYQVINRPHESLEFEKVVSGLSGLGKDFPGKVWLEVMLVEGVNDFPEEIYKMAALARKIAPAKIQLNSVTRKPAETSASPVTEEKLKHAAEIFGQAAEVITPDKSRDDGQGGAGVEEILEMLERRSCSLEDITGGLLIPEPVARELIWKLAAEGKIVLKNRGGEILWISAKKN